MLSYVYLAVGSLALGIIITFIMLFLCQVLAVDINKNLWLIAIPIILAIALNIWFIELYDRYRRK
jgi:membrane protein DedA with SNARE-associated domain